MKEVGLFIGYIVPRINFFFFNRGTQRQEYSSKPVKHSIVERILVFKR